MRDPGEISLCVVLLFKEIRDLKTKVLYAGKQLDIHEFCGAGGIEALHHTKQ